MANSKAIEKAKNMEGILAKNRSFVCLDIETSGLSPNKGSRIIEIGAVKIKDGKIVEKYQQLVHPEAKIYKKTIDLTGITNEMLKEKPVFGEVLPEFYQFIGNLPIIAHNAKFDWDRHLLYFFNLVGIAPSNEVVDTLYLSKLYHPERSTFKLDKMASLYDIALEDHHRALDDAIVTAYLAIFFREKAVFSDLFNMAQSDEIDMTKYEKPLIKRSLKIKQVKYWEKNITKKKKMQRIYVNAKNGSCYFDIKRKVWYNKNLKGNLDFKSIEKQVLKYLNLNSKEDLILYRK